eukprot:4189445-Prymnesium_polylepis.3
MSNRVALSERTSGCSAARYAQGACAANTTRHRSSRNLVRSPRWSHALAGGEPPGALGVCHQGRVDGDRTYQGDAQRAAVLGTFHGPLDTNASPGSWPCGGWS